MSTTVNISDNTVTITESNSSVNVTNNNTGTSVGVTGIDLSTITVSSPGPKGDKGEASFAATDDLSIQNISASGDISAEGNITAENARFNQIRNEGLIQTQVIFAGTDGLLSSDDNFKFGNNTLFIPNISGSATSTGSFAHGYFDGNVLIKSGEFLSWGSAGQTAIEGSTVSHKLNFITNGSSQMFLNSTGLGIGTTAPTEKLQVEGNISASGTIEANEFKLYRSGYDHYRLRQSSGTGLEFYNATDTNVTMKLDSGNVGIGTTAPTEKLQVEGNISASGTGSFESIALQGTSTDYYIGDSGGGPASNTLRIGSKTGTNTIAMELFHVSNPVSLGIDYDGGAGLAFIESAHSSYDVNTHLLFKPGGTEYWRIGSHGSNSSSKFEIKPAAASYDFIVADNSGNAILYSDTSTKRIGIGTTSPTQLLHVDGNTLISAEKYYYTAGTGAGFGSDASGNFKIKQNGADLIFGSASNVGIGTTTPNYKLSIDGGSIRVTNETTNVFGSDAHGGYIRAFSDEQIVRFNDADGSEFVRVMMSGSNKRVGIGTAAPSEKLHVKGGHLEVENAGNTNIYINPQAGSDGAIMFQEDGAIKAQIKSDASNDSLVLTDGDNGTLLHLKQGKVGIGTTSPSYMLDVSGSAARLGGNEAVTTLHIQSTGSLALPAVASQIQMLGYESRGQGIFFKDRDEPDKEWFAGVPYQNSNLGHYQIGYSSVPGDCRAEYLASSSLTIRNTGNVGIGTAAPQQKLHVASGDILIDNGQYYAARSNTNGVFKLAAITTGDVIAIGAIDYTTAPGTIFAGGDNVSITTGGVAGDIRLKITSAGNVGIGTTSPVTPLEVEFNEDTGSTKTMLFVDYNAVNNYGSGNITIAAGTNSDAKTIIEQVTSGGSGLYGSYNDTNIINAWPSGSTSTNSGNINFITNEHIRMTIGGGSQSGSIGIGTTTPSSKLEVNIDDDTTDDINLLKLKRTWANATSSDRAHGIQFSDKNATLATIYADRTNAASNYNGDLIFATNTGTSGTSISNKMIIKNSGDVGIGTTSPTHKLHLSGSLLVHASQIDFTDLPTSDPGVAGRLWNDGNTMKISAG